MDTGSKIEFLKACETGNLKKAKKYLGNGLIPDTSDIDAGWTPLMRASGWGNSLELVSYLIENGANLEEEEPEFGYTALTCAADEGNVGVIDLLISYGSDIDHQDFEGQTALMSAIVFNQIESVKRLVQLGANLALRDHQQRTAKEIAEGMEYDAICEFFKTVRL
ncbi:ankyrin repeat domain-containing protein [Zooshikella marina]|uniref:ankyrin repeat domain-containing protein n=1 Tax=Zooshikella ganghwensis TaxID=202772 RepID=UPI001BB0CD1C|nr:ankyrin repeat domain-containing protein [Zooshikella ganghwensis]MBU2709032.1 ankyrin repeat domain-containing protein [Zooshikella ganghwensis]